jgi:hypothetical protein
MVPRRPVSGASRVHDQRASPFRAGRANQPPPPPRERRRLNPMQRLRDARARPDGGGVETDRFAYRFVKP